MADLPSWPLRPPVLWPLAQDRNDKRKRLRKKQQPRGKAADPAWSSRILIVEDEWIVANEIDSVLSRAGYTVVGVAADEQDALLLAERERPDLVLMDVRLARSSDGLKVARTLRARFDIPSLFVTAHLDRATQEKAKDARPKGWLAKPFTEAQLLLAVRQALATDE